MRHGHGTTSNSLKERVRRAEQPARDMQKAEHNRRRSRGGGAPDELGVIQGQNGERGNPIDPNLARESGEIRH